MIQTGSGMTAMVSGTTLTAGLMIAAHGNGMIGKNTSSGSLAKPTITMAHAPGGEQIEPRLGARLLTPSETTPRARRLNYDCDCLGQLLLKDARPPGNTAPCRTPAGLTSVGLSYLLKVQT